MGKTPVKDRMMAVVFYGTKEGLRVEEVQRPSIGDPDQVSVEIKACGLCGTDVAMANGEISLAPSLLPFILGHEYTGVVTDVAESVQSIKPGDHVVVDPNVKCGRCFYCRSAKQNLCEDVRPAYGGFAEYTVVPQSAVYVIPEDMRWQDAALVEPVSCVVNGLKRAGIGSGTTVAIMGAGPIGLIWIELAKRSGASTVIAAEIKNRRIQAAEKMGADLVVNPNEEDPVKKIKERTNGRGVDVAVDVVGRPSALRQAIEAIRPGGRVVMFGTNPSEARIDFSPFEFMRYEKELVGSISANYTFLPAISLMYSRAVSSEILFTHRFELSRALDAFEMHRSGESIKALVQP